MNIENLSSQYKVIKLFPKDIPNILSICLGNPMYYKYCPPDITADVLISDMFALPPNKTYEDKYYIGFCQEDQLIAVMDLICKFPNDETAFIGFFMMAKELQGKGIATSIISQCCEYLSAVGLKKIKLGYAKGNVQSEKFWLKNNFFKTGTETQTGACTAVIMKRKL